MCDSPVSEILNVSLNFVKKSYIIVSRRPEKLIKVSGLCPDVFHDYAQRNICPVPVLFFGQAPESRGRGADVCGIEHFKERTPHRRQTRIALNYVLLKSPVGIDIGH